MMYPNEEQNCKPAVLNDSSQEQHIKLRYRLVLECLIGLFIAFLVAYGIGMTVDSIQFVYGNY